MPEEHHRASPSGFDRFEKCPASLRMQELNPEKKTSKKAQKGIDLHSRLEKEDYEGVSDEDMLLIQFCLDMKVKALKGRAILEEFNEKRVYLYDADRKVITFGTVDYLALLKDKTALMMDWKFGFIEVDSKTRQLEIYSLAVIQEFWPSQVEAWIIQPKILKADRRIIYGNDFDWRTKNIQDIRSRAYSNYPLFIPGKDQCQWCKARKACSAYALTPESLKSVK